MALKLLFVCTGNTCRSPMAEGLARTIFGPDIEVSSAGLEAWEGDKASSEALEVLRERGIDLSSHRARRVSPELLAEADWIIPMTKSQEEYLRFLYPEHAGKIKRLGDWAGQGRDIIDPWGGSLEVYRQSAKDIEAFLLELKGKII